MTAQAAALPTNQSPAFTSVGAPFKEYGRVVAEAIGKRENIASPAPRAPLQSVTSMNIIHLTIEDWYLTYKRTWSVGDDLLPMNE